MDMDKSFVLIEPIRRVSGTWNASLHISGGR
jgi:hypothetical protein